MQSKVPTWVSWGAKDGSLEDCNIEAPGAVCCDMMHHLRRNTGIGRATEEGRCKRALC